MIGVREKGSDDEYQYFTPYSWGWGLNDVSASDSGRTQDGVMHKNRLPTKNGQKRKIELTWQGTDRAETARILNAFNPEYIQCRFVDAMTNNVYNSTFYVGDRTAPVWTWRQGGEIYETVSFNIIEV